MANDDRYTVTSDWTAVELDGVDVTNQTVTVFALTNTHIDFKKSAVLPTGEESSSFMRAIQDSLKVDLGLTENLFAKTRSGTALIGVIPA